MHRTHHPLTARHAGFLFLLATVCGCDRGLEPTGPSAGTGPSAFTGVIRYAHWPPRDSLVDLRLIAFRSYPPGDIVTEVSSGNAIVYPPLGDTALVPFYVDSLRYIVTGPPATYAYVVVAQQYGPNILSDWRAVGMYTHDPANAVPAAVTVPSGDTVRNVDINVDFSNPPPQPF